MAVWLIHWKRWEI